MPHTKPGEVTKWAHQAARMTAKINYKEIWACVAYQAATGEWPGKMHPNKLYSLVKTLGYEWGKDARGEYDWIKQ